MNLLLRLQTINVVVEFAELGLIEDDIG